MTATAIAISVVAVVIPISRRYRCLVALVGVVVDNGSGGTAAPDVGRKGPDGRGDNKNSRWYHVGGGNVDGRGGGRGGGV